MWYLTLIFVEGEVGWTCWTTNAFIITSSLDKNKTKQNKNSTEAETADLKC